MLAEKRSNQSWPEDCLLHRARDGEADAFDRLFEQHKDGVYACLWHFLDGDADLVEEAVGSVFLNAYRSLDRFRSDSSFSTWLYRIAINEAHACTRLKRRRQLLGWLSLHEPKAAAARPSHPDDPAEQLLRSEEERLLHRAVDALPEPYRTPVILRYMSGLSAPEIATVLGRPAGTVRYQLSRAMQLLRDRLGNEWTK